jgi:hypothetical protein
MGKANDNMIGGKLVEILQNNWGRIQYNSLVVVNGKGK